MLRDGFLRFCDDPDIACCRAEAELGKLRIENDQLYAELAELQELAKAKADGRLVDLPCKVGDEIFSFRWNVKNEKYEVHTGKVKNVRYDSSDGIVMVSDGEMYRVFGKKVFLTREAAEKALQEVGE